MWLTFEPKDGESQRVEIGASRVVVGRDPGADFTLEDTKVSRRHAELRELPGGEVELRDLGSSNGTFVDGKRIHEPTVLRGGEQVRFGRTTVSVDKDSEPGDAGLEGAAAGASAAGTPPERDEVKPPPPPPPPPRHPAPGSPTPSVIERIKLRRGLRVATIVAGAAVVVAVAAIVLVVTGVFSGDSGDEFTTEKVVDTVRPSTLYIEAEDGTGTGWVLDADEKLIVTNAHVVGTSTSAKVNVEDARPEAATLVANAPCEDLALLRVPGLKDAKALELRSQEDLKQGERVIAVGFPGSLDESANLVTTEGVVSVVRTSVPPLSNLVRTDASINGGNSGGPLVDRRGRLVGVNDETAVGQQNENYAIGSDRVKEIAEKLRKGDSIGWSGLNLFPTFTLDNFDDVPPGFVIDSVASGSPAARARVPTPSLLVEVNGQTLAAGAGNAADEASFCKAINATSDPSTPVDMTFLPMEDVKLNDDNMITSFRFGSAQQISVGFQ